MKKFRLLCTAAVVVMSVFILTGCGRAKSSEPRNVAQSFLESLARADIQAAKELSTSQAAAMLDMIAPMIEPEPDFSIEFVDETIEGDKAVVNFRDNNTGDMEQVDLVKVDGEWKVDVTKDE